jgi:hypothetical protein
MNPRSANNFAAALSSGAAFAFLGLLVSYVTATAAIPAAGQAGTVTAQKTGVGDCEVAFVVKTSTLLKSEFAQQSGLLPRDDSQPEAMLLADSVSMRGAVKLPRDFSSLVNEWPQSCDFYLEITLKDESRESRFHEYVEQQVQQNQRFSRIREDRGTEFYLVEPETRNFGDGNPRVINPGYQIVFDGKRVTLASESFQYDPRNLPALTDAANKLLRQFSESDGFVVFDLKPAGGLIDKVLRKDRNEIQPLVLYLEMLQRINWAALSIEMNNTAQITLTAECAQSNDATDLEKLFESLVFMAKTNNQDSGPDAEMLASILNTVKIETRGREVKASIEITEEAAQQSRLAADETLVMNNQRQAAISFHNFESAMGTLPFLGREGDSDELSWRVRVLPFLDQMELYERFDHSQSWDSAKNIGILETTPMPKVFAGIEVFGETSTKTDLCWVKSNVRTIADITNGTSNTICFVKGNKLVNWTENNDMTPAEVMAQFKSLKPGEYLIATFYDGSVRKIPAGMDPKEFARMLDPTRDE